MNCKLLPKLLVGLETARNHNRNEDWLVVDCTGIVEHLESFVIFKGVSKLGELIVHPLLAGVILQLEAIGVKRTQVTQFSFLLNLVNNAFYFCFCCIWICRTDFNGFSICLIAGLN
ncbi:hypothetical protein ACOSP7_029074 [Xanthoceras sorbifolium]